MSEKSFKNGGCASPSEAVTSSVYAEARASETTALEDIRKGLPSASGLQRLMLCPGSWRAEAQYPEKEESAAAAAGTRLHKHMELGTLPEDAEEAEACVWCCEMERALVKEYIGEVELVEREERLWDACQRFSGQADVVYMGSNKAMVIDYKFGRGSVVEARQNCQLYGLSLLVFDNYPEVEEVYACILQPFVSRQKPKLVRFRKADEKGLRSYIYGALDAAQSEGATLKPGETQCKYCRAAGSCPALGLTVATASAMELTRWEQWNMEDRRKAWDASRLAKKFAEAVERKIRADLEADVEIPGLELGEGKVSFVVDDAAGAFGVLADALGVTGEEFTACCKVGMTGLDKLVHAKLAAKAGDGVKQTTKASREWLRSTLASYGSAKATAGTIKEK
jgi:hypothetical protein